MPSPNQRIGEYVLQSRIAAGTFGEVWRAHHHVWTDQTVAVKIPTDPQYLRNLQREGTAIHGLQHPNIVRAIGFDPYADPGYLVMELVPGTSLRTLIANKSLSTDDAVAVMTHVLNGLAYAHGKGVVHRDIKPENILVHERAFRDGFGAEGVVKVTDFGLGKATTQGAGSIAYSASMSDPASREIAGTLDYMAPEQRAGAAVDARADLYACGVVLFEMLTGERPAGTDLPSDINHRIPKWSRLDEAFRRSYARLDKRFASAEEFAKLLATAASKPSAMPPPVPPPPRDPAGRRVLTWELPDGNPSSRGGRCVLSESTYSRVLALLATDQKNAAVKALIEGHDGLEWQDALAIIESPGNFPPVRSFRSEMRPPVLQPPPVPRGAGATQLAAQRQGCPQCRQAVDLGDQFCMHCGVQLVENVRRCPQCGAYPDAGDHYCIFCGQGLTTTHATLT